KASGGSPNGQNPQWQRDISEISMILLGKSCLILPVFGLRDVLRTHSHVRHIVTEERQVL
ncbi:MAG: hypothetical protein C5B49_07210, partial [Bdellovibrio sp.]